MEDNFWYGIIKEYYKIGLYNDSDLEPFVQVGYITEEQKAEIIASKTVSNAS